MQTCATNKLRQKGKLCKYYITKYTATVSIICELRVYIQLGFVGATDFSEKQVGSLNLCIVAGKYD